MSDTAQRCEELNEAFGIDERAVFAPGAGGLPRLRLRHGSAFLSVYLHGAHVDGYAPDGREDVVWMSGASAFEAGKPLRGGIPICWPWFGPHPEDDDLPLHGFARLREWSVDAVTADDDGCAAQFSLVDDDETRDLWPHAFRLEYDVRLDASFSAALTVRNTGEDAFSFSEALHTYLAVAHIGSVAILGLESTPFLDKTRDGAADVQGDAPLRIDGETDRVYTGTESDVVVEDERGDRRIVVSKAGSKTTVVWNPWIAKAQRMADFGDDEWPGMVCVETANAAGDEITLEPGGVHRMGTTIRVEAVERPVD